MNNYTWTHTQTQIECALRVGAFTWFKFCVKRWPFASHCFQSRIRLRGKSVGRVEKKMISWKNQDVGTVGRHRNALFYGFSSECTRTISQVLGRVQFAPIRWILMQLSPCVEIGTPMCAHDKEEHVTNTINAMHVLRRTITQNVCERLCEWVCACVICIEKQQRRTWQFYLFIYVVTSQRQYWEQYFLFFFLKRKKPNCMRRKFQMKKSPRNFSFFLLHSSYGILPQRNVFPLTLASIKQKIKST